MKKKDMPMLIKGAVTATAPHHVEITYLETGARVVKVRKVNPPLYIDTVIITDGIVSYQARREEA